MYVQTWYYVIYPPEKLNWSTLRRCLKTDHKYGPHLQYIIIDQKIQSEAY